MAGTQARVLVVDDAQVMRRAVEKMLQADYEVVLAEDGEAGWEILARDERIDMLITDIQMPRLDGYGLICRVRADARARIRDLPIVTITGAEDDETRIRAYACGSTDFIIKPFDKKLLSSRVHAYLRLKQASLLYAAAAGAGSATDPLTRLSGLGGFLQAGKGLFQRAREGGQDLSVTALDLDDFAALRREHGETVASQLLVRVAGILTATVRREDVVARVGEAEFAILIPHADRAQAMAQCERLRERIAAEPLATAKGAVAVTASFGLVTLSADAPETFEKFLVLVEQRLSQARSDGGDRVGVTLLSDVMPEPEEVVLTAVPDSPAAVEANAAGEIVLGEEPGELSVDELEALVREEVARQRAANARSSRS
jgi:diguanylate cyclase (GGDEF)-like protein